MKNILIFGDAGSLGTELVKYYVAEGWFVTVASRDEAKHWDLRNKINAPACLKTIVCDVRDKARIQRVLAISNPDRIILAQALKQVDTCEENPTESVETNVIGTKNLLEAIEERRGFAGKSPKVVFVSTDKACNPINTYGMCKSISEKMVLTTQKESFGTYIITRYGNVISSKGSIIPLFQKQAEAGKPFTITHPDMTRFMMLLSESVKLIDDAFTFGSGGDIWIPKLDSFRVSDMAEYFSERYSLPILNIGIRPGEKMHEILMTEEEVRKYKQECENSYFVIRNTNNGTPFDYSSDKYVINKKELKRRLDSFLETGTYVK